MAVKLIEICDVSPPQGFVSPSTLPLTYFDLLWVALRTPSTQRVFFYHLPHCSTYTFLSSHLPNLKRSLSLALRHFHPLAGRLTNDSKCTPCLTYTDGNAVALIVAESNDNLQELTSNGPKEAARIRPLVPTLPISETDQPVVALQATIFPEEGVAIGITVPHAAMDGSSFAHFMRTWASICKSGDDSNILEDPPLHDRSVVPDPKGLRDAFLSKINQKNTHSGVPDVRESRHDVVRASFHLTAAQLDRLRRWVSSRAPTTSRCSSFTLAFAVVWTCLLKARARPPRETELAGFAVDCRARHDPPVPPAYFGNCIGGCFVSARGSTLVSDNGVAEAVATVGEGKKELEGGGAIEGMETILERAAGFSHLEPLFVAGSPRLRVYEVDFGWGRPAKVELVSIDMGCAMSLAENVDEEEGGVEIGLSQSAGVMDAFGFEFREALERCC